MSIKKQPMIIRSKTVNTLTGWKKVVGIFMAGALSIPLLSYSGAASALGGGEGCINPPICSILSTTGVELPGGYIYIWTIDENRNQAAILYKPGRYWVDCDENHAECIGKLEEIYDDADGDDGDSSSDGGTVDVSTDELIEDVADGANSMMRDVLDAFGVPTSSGSKDDGKAQSNAQSKGQLKQKIRIAIRDGKRTKARSLLKLPGTKLVNQTTIQKRGWLKGKK
jgi:hypothetical protein